VLSPRLTGVSRRLLQGILQHDDTDALPAAGCGPCPSLDVQLGDVGINDAGGHVFVSDRDDIECVSTRTLGGKLTVGG